MRAATRLLGLYRDAFSGLPREVWLLSLVALVNRAGTMVLPFLALYLTQTLGLNVSSAGALVGLYGVGSMAGSWIGGRASDRFGALAVQLASLAATGFGLLLLMVLESFWAWAVAVLLVSTVAEAFRPAVMAEMARISPAAVRARSFAALRLAINLGMAVGPAAGGLLAAHHYRWLFIGDAATCWAAALLLAATLPVAVRPRVPATTGQARRASPWRDSAFVAFLALVTAISVIFMQILSTMPLYFKEVYRLAESAIGLLLSLNALLIVLFEMVLVRALEHRHRLRVAAVGAVLVGGGMAMMPAGTGIATAIASVAVWTVGEMLVFPMTNAVVADRAGSAVGSYMGAYTLAFSVAFVAAPIVGTTAYLHIGPRPMWYGIGALGVVLGCGFAALERPLGGARFGAASPR